MTGDAISALNQTLATADMLVRRLEEGSLVVTMVTTNEEENALLEHSEDPKEDENGTLSE